MNKQKKIAAFGSILSNSSLIILKLIAGTISGSISIISEAIHSLSDLLASFFAFFAISKSSEPDDSEHQFGHGKYEDLSGLFEGTLIILASVFIIKEAITKLISGNFVIENNLETCIIVMGISVILNTIVSIYLFKIAKKSDSIALFADAEHLRTDIYSSLGVFIGLISIKLFDFYVLDPIVAIIIAVIIFETGTKICRETSKNLLDTSLPQNNLNTINEVLEKCSKIIKFDIKSIKTRKSGVSKNIEITLRLSPELTIKQSHDLCDCIEVELEKELKNTKTFIHIEPIK